MSIKLKNEIRELRGRIEILERKMNLLGVEKRNIAGQPEPDKEQPKKRGRKPKSN